MSIGSTIGLWRPCLFRELREVVRGRSLRVLPLLPSFVLCYQLSSCDGTTMDGRKECAAISFRIFVGWPQRQPHISQSYCIVREDDTDIKYLAEKGDIKIYWNSLLSLCRVLTMRPGPLVSNRIGRHAIENPLDLLCVQYKGKHNCPHLLVLLLGCRCFRTF
jgi:hypothetical protein